MRNDRFSATLVRRAILTLTAMVMAAVLGASSARAQGQRSDREVILGGLFVLSGGWSTLGQCSKVAMELAVEDVNRYLEGNAAGIRFAAAIEDTKLDPAVALEKARALRARGVRILIGPQSSAEVGQLRAFVEENDLLLISHASTAGALAIPGDNIFRFSPTDDLEGNAMSALIWEEGIRAVIPVWRDDLGNAGLEAAVRTHFTRRGGIMLDGVPYGANTTDFAPAVSALRTQLDEAIAKYGASRVSVYVAGFDEASQIFTRATADPVLGSVRWFGGDGVALSDGVTEDPVVAQFVMRTGFASALFGLDEGARDIWEPLRGRMRARVNHDPDAFAYAVYDAVWAAARGYIASGATLDREKLKRAFTTAAASGYGATGWTVLNDAGDRRYGDFDFWAVRMDEGGPRWVRVARYESRTKRLTR